MSSDPLPTPSRRSLPVPMARDGPPADARHHQLMDEYLPPGAMVDGDLRIVRLSPGTARFMTAPALVDRPLLLDAVLPPLRAPLHDALAHARAHQESVEAVRAGVVRDGKTVFVTMGVRPLPHDRAGRQWLLVVFMEAEAVPGAGFPAGAAETREVAQDDAAMVPAKRLQKQREARPQSEQSLHAQLQAANRQKDEFLAIVSHELKNPLNLIALNADLLKRLPDTRWVPSAVRIAETISASVASQAQIINGLLDLSRMQAGKLSLSRGPLPWDDVVQRVSAAMQPDAAAAGLDLTLQRQGDDFSVDADPARLEQIVWNLVSNAIKFTPPGGWVRLTLGVEGEDVCLRVADSGRGIEPDFADRLFDMFSQADSGAARRAGGLGIGLALSKRLVEMHGGQLQAQSPGRDQGSTFTVRLAHANARRAPPPAPAAGPSAVSDLRMLVVDDQPDALESFAMLLAMEGAKLTLAGSGEEALRAAREQSFDFLISDLAMPGMDGYTLLSRLREAGWAPPAIAVSGMGRNSDRERALRAGFDELVSKPVDMENLLSAIARARRLRRGTAVPLM
jgi:two-component system, chemotaxis family, CheB/CheR fusion protein